MKYNAYPPPLVQPCTTTKFHGLLSDQLPPVSAPITHPSHFQDNYSETQTKPQKCPTKNFSKVLSPSVYAFTAMTGLPLPSLPFSSLYCVQTMFQAWETMCRYFKHNISKRGLIILHALNPSLSEFLTSEILRRKPRSHIWFLLGPDTHISDPLNSFHLQHFQPKLQH